MKAVRREPRDQQLSTGVPFVIGLVLLAGALVLGLGWWVLGLAIVVPAGLWIAQRPQRGILLLVALLPFDGMLKALGPGILNPWKQVLILGLLILTFVCPPEARAQERRKLPGWVLPFALLLALGLASALLVDPTTALIGLRLSYFSALIGITIWRCPLDRRERDHLVTIFVALGIVTSLVGLWQQFVGHEYLHSLGYAYDDNIRFTSGMTLRSFSTFNLPFSFGFYLMLVFLIGLPMALAEPKRLRSKIFFLSIPLLSLALLFSFVRGAMLGLAVGLLYLAFHRYKLLVYGIPLVLVAALFIPSGANVSNAVFSSSSLGDRTLSWGSRLDQFADSPIAGTGIGTTGAAAEKAATVNDQDPDTTYIPDNSWLKVAFELGVFGLWFFVLWIVAIFLSMRATERSVTGIDQDFAAGATAQMLAIMVSALVATYFELTPMDQLFWVMIAVVATMAARVVDGPAPPEVPEASPAPQAHAPQ